MFQICETTDINTSTLGQKVFKFNSQGIGNTIQNQRFHSRIFPKCKSLIEINRPLISISCSSSAQILTLYDPLLPYLYVTPPAIEEGSSTSAFDVSPVYYHSSTVCNNVQLAPISCNIHCKTNRICIR